MDGKEFVEVDRLIAYPYKRVPGLYSLSAWAAGEESDEGLWHYEEGASGVFSLVRRDEPEPELTQELKLEYLVKTVRKLAERVELLEGREDNADAMFHDRVANLERIFFDRAAHEEE